MLREAEVRRQTKRLLLPPAPHHRMHLLCFIAPQMRRRLAADPMDAEAQRFLHETITRENVTTNRDLAMEHMPEAFTRCEGGGSRVAASHSAVSSPPPPPPSILLPQRRHAVR